MKKIKVGVVGLKHGMASVKEVLGNEAFELVALCSRTRESYDYLCGAEIAAELDNVTFTEPRELLIRQCRALRKN